VHDAAVVGEVHGVTIQGGIIAIVVHGFVDSGGDEARGPRGPDDLVKLGTHAGFSIHIG
jgi:hypothetical protein